MKGLITSGHEVFPAGMEIEIFSRMTDAYGHSIAHPFGWDTSVGFMHDQYVEIEDNERQLDLWIPHYDD